MKNKIAISEIPEHERPYEKCENHGAESLSDAELLAVLLRSGTKGSSVLDLSNFILYKHNSSNGILNLHQLNFQQLLKIHGVGRVKAVQILCISELAKRMAKACASHTLSFENPKSIANYYMEDMRHAQQEHMKLLLLNTKSKLIGEINLSKGTVNATLLSPRELFIEALAHGAVAIILIHNHPSGDPTPSKEDILITKRIHEAGQLLGIDLLDHIIIGNQIYTSFREKGIM